MPAYGLLPPDQGNGLLPWAWARERLEQTHNYWVATTRPDGRPHSMPVWGVWLDDCLYFSTGGSSRKARNLAKNPRCTVTTEAAAEAVIVDGAAEMADKTTLGPFHAAYKEKYDWDMSTNEGPIFIVRPSVAFAFIEAPDEFAATATRWRF